MARELCAQSLLLLAPIGDCAARLGHKFLDRLFQPVGPGRVITNEPVGDLGDAVRRVNQASAGSVDGRHFGRRCKGREADRHASLHQVAVTLGVRVLDERAHVRVETGQPNARVDRHAKVIHGDGRHPRRGLLSVGRGDHVLG